MATPVQLVVSMFDRDVGCRRSSETAQALWPQAPRDTRRTSHRRRRPADAGRAKTGPSRPQPASGTPGPSLSRFLQRRARADMFRRLDRIECSRPITCSCNSAGKAADRSGP
jgi:hypothetical protein